MTIPADDDTVIDDTAGSRFVIREGGAEAELLYVIEGDRLLLVHTEVPAAWGGRPMVRAHVHSFGSRPGHRQFTGPAETRLLPPHVGCDQRRIGCTLRAANARLKNNRRRSPGRPVQVAFVRRALGSAA